MSLLEAVTPLVEATALLIVLKADEETGAVTLDGDVTIEAEERGGTLGGRNVHTTYCVTYTVGIPQTYWEPADVDVVEVGTYPSLAGAVVAAITTLVEHRIAAYQDALADDQMAKDLAEERDLDLDAIYTNRERAYDPLFESDSES